MVVSLHMGAVFLPTEAHGLSVWRNLSTDFHSGCATLYSDEKYLKALPFSTFAVMVFLDSHPYNAALLCIFLMAKDVQCFFFCLLAIYSFEENDLFDSLTCLLLGRLGLVV